MSRDPCAYLRRGARLPLRVHLCICTFLHRGMFWSSSSSPEEQCFEYFSTSNTTVIWGLWACPQKNFLETNGLYCRKIPLQKVGEMEGVQYEGQFSPLLPLRVGVTAHETRQRAACGLAKCMPYGHCWS